MEIDLKDDENKNLSNVQKRENEKMMQSILEDMRSRSSEPPLYYNERRRLSECVEECDEEDEEEIGENLTKGDPDSSLNNSEVAAKVTMVGKFMVTRAHLSDSRNLHVDRKFFDDSLVEMRTQISSSGSNEEKVEESAPPTETDNKIWVKRSNASLRSFDSVS